jgi:hypothetical protein
MLSFDNKPYIYLCLYINGNTLVEMFFFGIMYVSLCDVIRFLSVCCAYEDNIACRYSDDESEQSNITGMVFHCDNQLR